MSWTPGGFLYVLLSNQGNPIFGHLRGHLSTNVYSSFNVHKTRAYGIAVSTPFSGLFDDEVAGDEGSYTVIHEDRTQSKIADILNVVDSQCDRSRLNAKPQCN